MDPRPICWVDGRLRPRDAAWLRVDDSAFAEGRGCYTTVLIAAGRPRFVERHVLRLVRSAAALELPPCDPRALATAMRELGRAAFGNADGVVRIQLSRDGEGALHVVGVPRGLGADPAHWLAVTAPQTHPGAPLAGGHKLTSRLLFALASDHARDSGADEALLFDRCGRLVEGSRSNILAASEAGGLWTPPIERGAVVGIALEVLRERIPELRQRDLAESDLRRARGVFAVNAVRGARRLAALDGRPLARPERGLEERLAAALSED